MSNERNTKNIDLRKQNPSKEESKENENELNSQKNYKSDKMEKNEKILREINTKNRNKFQIKISNELIESYNKIIETRKKQLIQNEMNLELDISYFINPNKNIRVEERLYKHEGISCSSCGIKPISGHRYMCLECPYYNLCSLCELKESHEHYLTKIRFKEDLDNKNYFSNDFRFKVIFLKKEVNMNKDNKCEFNLENIGTRDWPKDTSIICLKDCSDCDFDPTHLGKVESGKKGTVNVRMKKINFSKNNKCRCVFTLKGKDRDNNLIKFLFPYEIDIKKI